VRESPPKGGKKPPPKGKNSLKRNILPRKGRSICGKNPHKTGEKIGPVGHKAPKPKGKKVLGFTLEPGK